MGHGLDPAASAFARWLEVECESIGSSDEEQAAWIARSRAAEQAVVEAAASGPIGLAAKLKLVRMAEGTRHAPELLDQVIAALEGLSGPSTPIVAGRPPI